MPESAWMRQPQVTAMGQSDPLPRTPHGQWSVRRQRFGVNPPGLGRVGTNAPFWPGACATRLQHAAPFGSWLQGPEVNLQRATAMKRWKTFLAANHLAMPVFNSPSRNSLGGPRLYGGIRHRKLDCSRWSNVRGEESSDYGKSVSERSNDCRRHPEPTDGRHDPGRPALDRTRQGADGQGTWPPIEVQAVGLGEDQAALDETPESRGLLEVHQADDAGNLAALTATRPTFASPPKPTAFGSPSSTIRTLPSPCPRSTLCRTDRCGLHAPTDPAPHQVPDRRRSWRRNPVSAA